MGSELEVSVERFAEIPIGWDRGERKFVDGVGRSTVGGFEEGAIRYGDLHSVRISPVADLVNLELESQAIWFRTYAAE